MKPIYAHFAGAMALTCGIAACVPAPRPLPPVQTRPVPAPSPAPAPAPAPTSASWMDAPQTPGDWSYRAAPGGGSAQFGQGNSGAQFTMRCDRVGRSVILTRAGMGGAQMTIRSESLTRALTASTSRDGVPGTEARLAANDRLLDAMALSKGRFAVEAPGTATLYLPSWAEVTRVIEDCR